MKTIRISTTRLATAADRPSARRKVRTPESQQDVFPGREAILRSTFRYRIIRPLGDGGMGRAFLAHEYDSIDSYRFVALKMLHTPEDRELQETFILEAKLMRLMNHANILNVYGFEKGTSAFNRMLASFGITDSFESFMVMEYVPGFNIDDLHRQHRLKGVAFVPQIAASIVSRVARGLAYAHDFKHPGISAHGVIHRDITPSNVLIHRDGRIKISDFGIAYPFHPNTKNPLMCGTPTYIAPEVLAGGKPTTVSDVYSAGLLLDLMLTGKPRYPIPANKSSAEILRHQLRRIQTHKFQPESYRHIPPRLVEICRSATTTDPSIRYQSANDLAVDLELFLHEIDSSIGPQQIAVYLEAIESGIPGEYRSREFLTVHGRETLEFHSPSSPGKPVERSPAGN